MATEQTGQPSFETVLETDMKALAAEIKNQRERTEMKEAGDRELLKEAIRSFSGVEKKPQAAPAPAAAASGNVMQNPLPAYASNAPAEVKLEIEYLLEVAFRTGLNKALSESQKSSYFVQDAFHDALAGKLYPELQKRGIVK